MATEHRPIKCIHLIMHYDVRESSHASMTHYRITMKCWPMFVRLVFLQPRLRPRCRCISRDTELASKSCRSPVVGDGGVVVVMVTEHADVNNLPVCHARKVFVSSAATLPLPSSSRVPLCFPHLHLNPLSTPRIFCTLPNSPSFSLVFPSLPPC